MNYTLHENGWTVLANVDLKIITQDEVNQLARLIASNTCVVIRNQFLTVDEELRVINMFKNPEVFVEEHIPEERYKQWYVENTGGMITRVTGKKNEHGTPGIAGYVDEMTWHCNHPYRKERRPIVWLYGVKGTEGSRTSWNNNILSYNDLDQKQKDFFATLKIRAKKGMEHAERKQGKDGWIVDDYTPPLVYTNNAGKIGLFFPFLQIGGFVGMTEKESQDIIKPLAEHTIQEKYCYHHDWQDGDLVLSEQWLGIHKRWRFEAIENRMVHRAVFDFPDQDYTQL
jgi:alpha-ketoglutarate-dependent taurine dioxygenase